MTKTWDPTGGGMRSVSSGYEQLRSKTYSQLAEHGEVPLRRPRTELHEIEAPEYEPGRRYTKAELSLMADKLLYENSKVKPSTEEPVILLSRSQWRHRYAHEIYCTEGQPDPSIVAGLYWRTHPQGRSFRTPQEMLDKRASFYK